MKTIPLSNTTTSVSALCLGTMNFGTTTDEATSFRLLDQYVDAGGSFLDSANIYAHWNKGASGGESETLLGKWMRARKNRSHMFVATKVGFEYPGVPRGLTYSLILEECEKSLQRLGVDTIDLYYAHKDDQHTPLEETMEAFERLVQAGKVRYIGASNYLPFRLEEARWISQSHAYSGFCCVQQRYTYLRPKPGVSFDPQETVTPALLNYSRMHNLTLLAYSVFLGGAYTRPDRQIPDEYIGSDSNARITALRAIAAEKGATPNQVILAWMLTSDPCILPVIAASTKGQLDENLKALDIKLTEEDLHCLDLAGA